jgi:23S rRNA (pseudouridine1915-N3)-methyltransferase
VVKIKIVAVGGLKEKFWADAVAEYEKRLQKYCKFEIVQIRESSVRSECAEIATKVAGHVILFDVAGAEITSVDLAKKIAGIMQTKSTITFIIGGSDGIGDGGDIKIDERISFGRITLPHQLFRVVAVEQIYRAFTILGGEKYNK